MTDIVSDSRFARRERVLTADDRRAASRSWCRCSMRATAHLPEISANRPNRAMWSRVNPPASITTATGLRRQTHPSSRFETVSICTASIRSDARPQSKLADQCHQIHRILRQGVFCRIAKPLAAAAPDQIGADHHQTVAHQGGPPMDRSHAPHATGHARRPPHVPMPDCPNGAPHGHCNQVRISSGTAAMPRCCNH